MDADVKLMVALTYIYTDMIWRLASNGATSLSHT